MSEVPPSPLSSEDGNVPDGTIVTDMSRQLLPSSIAASPSRRKLRVLVLSSDTGGGHRASAQALRAALEELYPAAVHVDIVDFWVELAAGPFVNFPKQYTFLAKRPWMWKFSYEFARFPLGRALTETMLNALGHRKVRDAFIKYAPDLIISVHPLVNTLSQKVLREMRIMSGSPQVPYVTVVTDLGGAHPTWFHKNVDMTYIPSLGVRAVAEKVCMPSAKLRQFGLPVRKDFWNSPREKEALRAQLGMRPQIPAVLVVGGGDGVGGLKAIVECLAQSLVEHIGGDHVQLIVICGKNRVLRSYLQSKTWSLHLSAQGYVNNMSDWMAACDIICTKAGPGTIAESLIRALPIVVTGFLPGQEEANVKYVVSEQVGEFARKPRKIAKTVIRWLGDPELLAAMSQRARQLGRPQASIEIARDVMNVARVKIAENSEILERQRRLREAVGVNEIVERPRRLLDSSPESHLLYRLRFLLRVVFGSMLVHKALYRDGITPPSSPMDTASRVSEDMDL